MKQDKKKFLMWILVFVVVFAIALLAGYLALNRDALVGSSGDEGALSSNDQANIIDDGYMYLQGTKKAQNVEFSNIRIKKVTENKCEFLADVENLTEEYLKTQSVTIKVIDNSGEVDEIFAGLLTELAPYEPNRFKTQVLSDITDVVDIEIEVDGA